MLMRSKREFLGYTLMLNLKYLTTLSTAYVLINDASPFISNVHHTLHTSHDISENRKKYKHEYMMAKTSLQKIVSF